MSAYLDTAWEAADAAGRIICANWQKPKNVEYKGVVDLVTDTDRQCEQTIEVFRRPCAHGRAFLAGFGKLKLDAGERTEFMPRLAHR